MLIFCSWHAILVTRPLDPGVERARSALLTKPVVGSMVSRGLAEPPTGGSPQRSAQRFVSIGVCHPIQVP